MSYVFYCMNDDCDWDSETSQRSRYTDNWMGGSWKCPLCHSGVRSKGSTVEVVETNDERRDAIRKNSEWLKEHADDPKYAGKWIALDTGVLVAAYDSSEELIEAVDDPKNYLVTRLGPYDWEPKDLPEPKVPTPFVLEDTGRRNSKGHRIVKLMTRNTAGPNRFGNAERLGSFSLDDEHFEILKLLNPK